jgi:CRP-like cAMP-binding protein
MAESYEQILMASPLFSGFTEHGVRSVLDSGEVATCEPGAVLFEEGAAADAVLFLLDGEVEAFVERDGKEIVFSTMGAGSLIGELAVLCEAPRAATVRVVQQATVLQWNESGFRRLLLRIPQLARGVFSQALKVVLENQQALIEELARK